jgi:putative peptidoglycan lipid II flippase
MVSKLVDKGKRFFTDPQESVLSAATVIMFMIIASRVLGLVRQRTLAHFFLPGELSLFFAAFRLPDLVFEVLVFGTFSSAFIPVFTKSLDKGNHNAWKIASTVVNLGLLIFILLAFIIGFGADFLYGIVAPGYSAAERAQIVQIARILFAAQGFFVISYVLTGVLESLRRFLVPALAPLFYNIGIILGTIFMSESRHLMAPTYGVLIGAMGHFLIQLPLAYRLGFRFSPKIEITKDVRKIGRLALPRVIEVSFLQASKVAELFFSSIISTASYTYYTFGNSLQLLPVGLFGTSIAKAALPSLAKQSDDSKEFTKTLLSSLYELIFLTAPIAAMLVVLRIPVIRLVYGTDIFGWTDTVQTGYVLSAFAVGIVFQASVALLARGFYAMHDTRTPVFVSLFTILSTIIFDFVFIRMLGYGAWGLAAAFSIGVVFQASTLLFLLNKKIMKKNLIKLLAPIVKILLATVGSGLVMFFLVKIFDKSVWVKRLSFLGKIEATKALNFEKFVLDTRYTINLMALTVSVALVGVVVYIVLSLILGSKEVFVFFDLVKRIFVKRKVSAIPKEEQEPVAPMPGDSAN